MIATGVNKRRGMKVNWARYQRHHLPLDLAILVGPTTKAFAASIAKKMTEKVIVAESRNALHLPPCRIGASEAMVLTAAFSSSDYLKASVARDSSKQATSCTKTEFYAFGNSKEREIRHCSCPSLTLSFQESFEVQTATMFVSSAWQLNKLSYHCGDELIPFTIVKRNYKIESRTARVFNTEFLGKYLLSRTSTSPQATRQHSGR